jgi:hypothetical protein
LTNFLATLKPGDHFIDSRVDTRRLSSYGSAAFNLPSPTSAMGRHQRLQLRASAMDICTSSNVRDDDDDDGNNDDAPDAPLPLLPLQSATKAYSTPCSSTSPGLGYVTSIDMMRVSVCVLYVCLPRSVSGGNARVLCLIKCCSTGGGHHSSSKFPPPIHSQKTRVSCRIYSVGCHPPKMRKYVGSCGGEAASRIRAHAQQRSTTSTERTG